MLLVSLCCEGRWLSPGKNRSGTWRVFRISQESDCTLSHTTSPKLYRNKLTLQDCIVYNIVISLRLKYHPMDIGAWQCLNSTNLDGIRLPVYRCARGSTSLESFHLHLARFIPGTSANTTHFQAYLLDGIARWNAKRASQAIQAPRGELRSYDIRLQQKINQLSETVHGQKIIPHFQPPAQYTGNQFLHFIDGQCHT